MGNGILITVCLASTLAWWPQANRPCKLLCALTGLYTLGVYGTLTRWLGSARPRGWAWWWRSICRDFGACRSCPPGCSPPDCWRRPTGSNWWLFSATRGFRPKRRKPRCSCGRSWPGSPGTCSWTGPCWAAGWASTRTSRITISTTAAPSWCWRRPRVCAAQRLPLLAGGDGAGGTGFVAGPAGALGPQRLAIVAGLQRRRPGSARRDWCSWRFLASYVCTGMFHDVSLIVVVQMLLFFMAGLVAGLVRQVEKTATPRCD